MDLCSTDSKCSWFGEFFPSLLRHRWILWYSVWRTEPWLCWLWKREHILPIFLYRKMLCNPLYMLTRWHCLWTRSNWIECSQIETAAAANVWSSRVFELGRVRLCSERWNGQILASAGCLASGPRQDQQILLLESAFFHFFTTGLFNFFIRRKYKVYVRLRGAHKVVWLIFDVKMKIELDITINEF